MTVGGVNYDCTDRTKKLARKNATCLALRNLNDGMILIFKHVLNRK